MRQEQLPLDRGRQALLRAQPEGIDIRMGRLHREPHDATFHPLIERLLDESVVLIDSGFHSRDGDPVNMKICKRGTWNVRMVVETVLSMLTVVFHLNHLSHRASTCLRARLAWTMAAYNILIGWHTPKTDQHTRMHLSIAAFSL